MSDTPIEVPTRQQLKDEIGFKAVSREDRAERCGDSVTAVFRRDCDDTYWQARYNVSSDGFINDLAGGEYCEPVRVVQVTPTLVETTMYSPVGRTSLIT
jgi:hypothetical protein